MRRGLDVSVKYDGLYVVHQNIPGKRDQHIQLKESLLFLPLQGEITVKTDTKSFTLGPGRMLYMPPRMDHSFVSSLNQGDRIIALLDFERGCTGFEALILPLSSLIKEILFYLLLNPKTKHHVSLVSILFETLGEILESNFESDGSSVEHLESKVRDFRIMAALEFMKANLGRRLSMNQVAKKSGLSVRSLNRLMVSETGVSPKGILLQYRVAIAKSLLQSGNKSITEVAQEVGYQSLSQFILMFRKTTGHLPSEWPQLANSRTI